MAGSEQNFIGNKFAVQFVLPHSDLLLIKIYPHPQPSKIIPTCEEGLTGNKTMGPDTGQSREWLF